MTQVHFFNSLEYLELEAERLEGTPIQIANGSGPMISLVARPIPGSTLRDGISVYGYPDLDQREPISAQVEADRVLEALRSAEATRGLTSVFFRLGFEQQVESPSNSALASKVHVGDVVAVDLQRDWADILGSFRPNLRSAIRKKGDGIDVARSDDIAAFHSMYSDNMARVGARGEYFFSLDYLQRMLGLPGARLFLTEDAEGPLAGALILSHGDMLFYHLGATSDRGLPRSALRFVLSEVMRQHANGPYRRLVLGGGFGGDNDSLLQFKRGFSKEMHPVFALKVMLDADAYSTLAGSDGSSDPFEGFFPAYRDPKRAESSAPARLQRTAPMPTTSFPVWPSFSEDEVAAVSNVLRSGRVNYWTGQEARQFETEFAEWTGARHAIALTNGTVALDLALQGLGIGPGDEVVVTPRSFMASTSCVVNAGAAPVFADVDRDSGNLTAETIAAALTPRTRAVIVVHLAGWPCDMQPIMELAAERGFKVIEDCAQAHGARYCGRSVGTIGHVGAWSFCQDKIMTTGGEGGMVTTNDKELWSRMWSFKDHGKSWEAVYERSHVPGHRWLHESFGTNWRITEMQAAIGRVQLRRMREWTGARNRNADAIGRALAPFSGPDGAVRIPEFRASRTEDAASVHARYKYYAYIRPDALSEGWSRDRIVEEITARGVPCYQGSCSEIYLERAFDGTGWRPEAPLPVARELGATSVMFLVHPTLTERDSEHMADVIREVFTKASRTANCAPNRQSRGARDYEETLALFNAR